MMMKKISKLLVICLFVFMIVLVVFLIFINISLEKQDELAIIIEPNTIQLEENKEDELKGDYKFQGTGPLNAKALDEYLQNYDKVVEDIHTTTDPFSAKSLSNESLGIPNN